MYAVRSTVFHEDANTTDTGGLYRLSSCFVPFEESNAPARSDDLVCKPVGCALARIRLLGAVRQQPLTRARSTVSLSWSVARAQVPATRAWASREKDPA